MFHGTITALLTPFKNGTIDEEAYRAHIEWQLEQGVNGVVPCGTTGESATMTHAEHESAIRICIDQVKGRVPVIAGAGSNNTVEAISLTRFAKKAGADAALLISPYYNKPTQEGIFQHFKAINDEVALPMFVYNVPGRTGSNVLPATQARMARELEHVIGCKEATANLVQVSNILEQCPEDYILLSGDDFTVLPTYAVGGKGVHDERPHRRVRTRRLRRSPPPALRAGTHEQGHVCGKQPHPLQDRPFPHGPYELRSTPASLPALRKYGEAAA